MLERLSRIFKSGNSMAVRIPKAFNLAAGEVRLIQVADGVLVRDERAHARRMKAFAALAGSCPDFPQIPANTAPNIARDWE